MQAQTAKVYQNFYGRWSFQKTNAARASKLFKSRRDAIRHGRAVAKRLGITLYIFNWDATVHSVVRPSGRSANR
jgi:Uncharacterized protein conserved in bacteria (DUF2188)